MLFQPRIKLVDLAGFCRRAAMSISSGIDLRRTLERETERAAPAVQPHLSAMRDAVARGDALAEALHRTGAFFPVLTREMVAIGEQSGNLAEVLGRLADHYEHQVALRRTLLAALTWPMIQLAAAVTIIGLLIWILGWVARISGRPPIDVLGIGLVGTQGLVIYLGVVAAAAALVGVAVRAITRGALWTRPMQRLLVRLPGIGGCLRTIAISRMAWSMQLTFNVEMDVRQSMRLALRSTGNDHYQRHADQIVADLSAGHEIHAALRRTGAFDSQFVDAVEAAELSGQLVESLGRLSRQYEDRAQAALKTLATLVGFAVWALVAALIAALILRLGFFYVNMLYKATQL